MRLVTVDVDSIEGLEALWAELRHRRATRDADPILRAAIERRIESLAVDIAAPILQALDELHPAAVLECYFTELVPNMPTVGWWRRRRWAAAA
jgi:hypothetical protein